MEVDNAGYHEDADAWKFQASWKISQPILKALDTVGAKTERFKIPGICGMTYELQLFVEEEDHHLQLVAAFFYEHSTCLNVHISVSSQGEYVDEYDCVFDKKNYRHRCLMDMTDIPPNDLAPDEFWTIKVSGTIELTGFALSVEEAPSAMSILWEQPGKDFMLFMEDDKSIGVDRWVLDYFSTFFKRLDRENLNSYRIAGYSYDVVRTAIFYYYQKDIDAFFKDKLVDALDCVKFAHEYEMPQFKEYAAAFCLVDITLDKVVNLANQANALQCSALLDACISYMILRHATTSIPHAKDLDNSIVFKFGRRCLHSVVETSKTFEMTPE